MRFLEFELCNEETVCIDLDKVSSFYTHNYVEDGGEYSEIVVCMDSGQSHIITNYSYPNFLKAFSILRELSYD
jgi:hypothetical protein